MCWMLLKNPRGAVVLIYVALPGAPIDTAASSLAVGGKGRLGARRM